MQRVLDAPWRERSLAFSNAFDAPMTLVTGRFQGGTVRKCVALCDEEIAPMMAKFRKPPSIHRSPFRILDVEIETRSISIDEICEEPDPRPVNVQEGLGNDLLRDLLDRFGHLKDKDVSTAETWVWIEEKPYPIIAGKLHYLCQKYSRFTSKGDAWLELPFQDSDCIPHQVSHGELNLPARLALTLASGFMRAFDTSEGFIGPDDFVWLKALPTSVRARASFEGIRDTDLEDLSQNPHEEKLHISSEPGSYDCSIAAPRITGTYAYGPGSQKGSLVRITPQGESLVPGSSKAVINSDHMIALTANDGSTLNGPWHISEDGASTKGPALEEVECPWWGFAVRKRMDARDDLDEQWCAVLRSTCDFASSTFSKSPQLGPQLKSLIAPIKHMDTGALLWGAICPETGRDLIPFEFVAYEDVTFQSDCLIFTDTQDRHHVFDENGTLAFDPCKTFEMPETARPSRHPAFGTRKTDEERRDAYLRHDLPWVFETLKAQAKFGDLNPYAPTLAAYKGRLTDGRKDAQSAGLWRAFVEIVRDGEIYGVKLSKGMKGQVSFGDLAQFGGSSMFGWENELPVTGLLAPHQAGRVIGVPFEMLRVSNEDPA